MPAKGATRGTPTVRVSRGERGRRIRRGKRWRKAPAHALPGARRQVCQQSAYAGAEETPRPFRVTSSSALQTPTSTSEPVPGTDTDTGSSSSVATRVTYVPPAVAHASVVLPSTNSDAQSTVTVTPATVKRYVSTYPTTWSVIVTAPTDTRVISFEGEKPAHTVAPDAVVQEAPSASSRASAQPGSFG